MPGRRQFVKKYLAGAGLAVLGRDAVAEFVLGQEEPGLGVGFRNDAPGALDAYSREAEWGEARAGGLVQCVLCPHACILGENDRGFCRTRVVKNGRLHTVAYGNLCSLAVDPIEKKPLYHFLPGTPIVSVAIGGCNLRCLNCQNWEISQARPADVHGRDAAPGGLAGQTAQSGAPSLAFTYSEPLVWWEYVRDTAREARALGVRSVLVTAGYVNPAPLRELCRVTDAVTLDVKAFREPFYREVSGGRLSPVLRTLEILREEGVWLEASFLLVPGLSDSPEEIGRFAKWAVEHLGADVPFHLLRFHPAHRLAHLPPTSVPRMDEARARARDAGLKYVYLGNVPGHESAHTACPSCGRRVLEREGLTLRRSALVDGRCPCGAPIAGVFA